MRKPTGKDTRIRINFPLDSENYEFLRLMGSLSEQGMCNYLNTIIREYREEPDHAKDFAQAKALAATITKRTKSGKESKE